MRTSVLKGTRMVERIYTSYRKASSVKIIGTIDGLSPNRPSLVQVTYLPPEVAILSVKLLTPVSVSPASPDLVGI